MDTSKSNKFHFSFSSVTLILISAVLLFVYVPMMFHWKSIDPIYPVYGGDSQYYDRVSQNILDHHVFSDSSAAPFKPSTFVMPLYPVLLAVFKFAFGSLSLIPIFQMLLTGFSAYLIFLLGRRFFSDKVGLLAAMLFILDPTVIYHTLIVMTDMSYVFLLVLSIWLLFGSEYKNAYALSTVGGFLLGVAMLTRVVSMFLIFLIVPLYIVAKWKEMEWKKILISTLILIFAYSVVLVPWMARNKEVSGVWGIASEKSTNLFHYYIPDFLVFKNHIPVEEARKMLISDLAQKIGSERAKDAGSLENASAAQDVALGYVWDDPFGYAKFHAIKTIPFFLSSGFKNFFVSYNDMLGYQAIPTNKGNMTDLLFSGQFGQFLREIQVQPFVTLEQIYWVFVGLGMLIAILFSKPRFYGIVLCVLVLYFAALTGSIAYSRFRLPALPFMLILAAQGFMIFKNRFMNPVRDYSVNITK